MKLQFYEHNFDPSFFEKCRFENYTFRNSQLINSNLSKIDFKETNFVSCQFVQFEKRSLIKASFASYPFIKTNFYGFSGMSLDQAIVVNSKLSKINRSMDLKGDFLLKSRLLNYLSFVFCDKNNES